MPATNAFIVYGSESRRARMLVPYAVGDRVRLINTPKHLNYEGVPGQVLGFHGSASPQYAGPLFLIIGYDQPVAGMKAGVWIKACVEKVPADA